MRKIVILCVFITLFSNLSFAADSKPAYQMVVPFQDSEIVNVNRNSYITQTGDWETRRYSLYSMNGECILQDEQEIRFAYRNPSIVMVKRSGGWGVYSERGECLVPCRYTVVSVNGDHCMALKEGVYLRPGAWYGDRVLYSLNTKKIIKDIGYGDEFYFGELYETDPPGFKSLFDGSSTVVYNGENQMILQIPCENSEEVNLRNSGRYASFVTLHMEKDDIYYLYSNRGRLISQGEHSLWALPNEQYFVESGEPGRQVRTFDGDIVIPFGTFDVILGNNGVRPRSDICADNYTFIVSKNGKYGIMRLPEYREKCSPWAKNAVDAAVETYNIVPADLRGMWEEKCNREEFCRMLSQTVRVITGKTLPELAADKAAAEFIDCDDRDVSAAAALGIVAGTGSRQFSPSAFITREQAAVMLQRTCLFLQIENEGQPISFSDEFQISPWAKEAVSYVSAVTVGNNGKLMQGVGNGRFDPQGHYTVEQSIATFVNLINY